jgi:hypothetical protein
MYAAGADVMRPFVAQVPAAADFDNHRIGRSCIV